MICSRDVMSTSAIRFSSSVITITFPHRLRSSVSPCLSVSLCGSMILKRHFQFHRYHKHDQAAPPASGNSWQDRGSSSSSRLSVCRSIASPALCCAERGTAKRRGKGLASPPIRTVFFLKFCYHCSYKYDKSDLSDVSRMGCQTVQYTQHKQCASRAVQPQE